MDPRWFSVAGLLCDMIGAIFLAYGLFMSRARAEQLEQTVFGGPGNPVAIEERMKQSRNAVIGVAFLLVGFSLQIVGNWPK